MNTNNTVKTNTPESKGFKISEQQEGSRDMSVLEKAKLGRAMRDKAWLESGTKI